VDFIGAEGFEVFDDCLGGGGFLEGEFGVRVEVLVWVLLVLVFNQTRQDAYRALRRRLDLADWP
jgi:hypothetical protein